MSTISNVLKNLNENSGKYKTLNDVPLEGFEKGKTQIYYVRKELLMKSSFYGVLDDLKSNLYKKLIDIHGLEMIQLSHALIGSIKEEDLEKIFQNMQAEFWSPEGEANDIIKKANTGHTSMSVGDIIVLPNGEINVVDMDGFYKINDLS